MLAVTSACGIAVGASKLLKAVPKLQAFGPFVPYLAVITAGSCNVGFTRMDEVLNGIDVYDADGKKVGRSIAAGQVGAASSGPLAAISIPSLIPFSV